MGNFFNNRPVYIHVMHYVNSVFHVMNSRCGQVAMRHDLIVF